MNFTPNAGFGSVFSTTLHVAPNTVSEGLWDSALFKDNSLTLLLSHFTDLGWEQQSDNLLHYLSKVEGGSGLLAKQWNSLFPLLRLFEAPWFAMLRALWSFQISLVKLLLDNFSGRHCLRKLNKCANFSFGNLFWWASTQKCMNDAIDLLLKLMVKNKELPKCSTIWNWLINDGVFIYFNLQSNMSNFIFKWKILHDIFVR